MVPQTLCKEYLRQLHKGHPRIDATKRRERETVYWPSLMLDIDSDVASCQPCNSAPPAERTTSHSPGSRPPLVRCKRRHIQLEWTAVPDTH